MSDQIARIVAATAHSTGKQVYLTACDEWTENPAYAEILDNDEDADFRLFVATKQEQIIANPELLNLSEMEIDFYAFSPVKAA